MSLDERLKEGLEGLDAIEATTDDRVIDSIVAQGRRHRWNRRVAALAIVLAAIASTVIVVPRAIDLLGGSGLPRPAAPNVARGVITTIAGTGAAESFGDGGPATQAGFGYPVDLAVDAAGNLYILDVEGDRVRKIDPSGMITTVVGLPAGGDEPVAAAGEPGQVELNETTGLAIDAEGNLYVGGGKGGNDMVVMINPSGDVTTVAGTGREGFSGDGGPATEATLRNVWDIAVDAEGDVFILDSGNRRVRKVDPTGEITTIAGTGKVGFSGDAGPAVDARLGKDLGGLAVDASGNVYVLDDGNNRIRRIDSAGIITTFAGPGTRGENCHVEGKGPPPDEGRPASDARLCAPEHITIDASGNFFVADTYNHRVVMIDTDGIVTTVAGEGKEGFLGDGGPAVGALLSAPSGVAIAPGILYIADSNNRRIRRVIL